jgi:hypothetical protein
VQRHAQAGLHLVEKGGTYSYHDTCLRLSGG